MSVMRVNARLFDVEGPAHIGAEDLGCFFLEGGHAIVHDESRIPVGPRGCLIMPFGQEFRISVPAEATFLLVRFPLSLLDGMLPEKPHKPVTVDAQKILARASHSFAREVTSGGMRSGTAVETYAIGQLLAEMIGGVLLDTQAGFDGESIGDGSIRDRARAIIAQSYSDPMLSSRIVAVESQVSLRRLQAAFTSHGKTVSDVIRAHRVEAAEALLGSHRYNILSLEDVAQRAGFRSGVNMRRAFKQLGKRSPSEYR
ncbi:AraC family transcriptional regulator [Paramicrobacterium chengjingii]|uniref:AraC family transcriptional regulator n=1 Tax=Paramicrobacterium chengjingii TaxID=2769067 RepID=A0ABX6YG99_9MICO|nr:AraC family transcriptional regulator [Microbacterium chengjingii]